MHLATAAVQDVVQVGPGGVHLGGEGARVQVGVRKEAEVVVR